MTAHARLHYPTKAKVCAAVEQAKAAGLDVAAIEVKPDGSIVILSAAAFPSAPRDEFEAWEQAGRL